MNTKKVGYILALLLLPLLAACGSQATAAPTQPVEPSASAEPYSTAAPTAEPAPTTTPTATAFPYELPPLPSLIGITVEKLPACDVSVLGESDLAYYASVVTENGKRYLVPHPTQLNIENFKSCDLYVVDTNSSPRDKSYMNSRALLKVLLNEMYAEGSDYEGVMYQDIRSGSSYDSMDGVGKIAVGRLQGVVGESLAWILKSGIQGVIYIDNTKLEDPLNREAYFFNSAHQLTEGFLAKCSECVYEVFPYKIVGDAMDVFGVYNDINGSVFGLVERSGDEYVFMPRYIPGFDYSTVEINFSPSHPPKPLEYPFARR